MDTREKILSREGLHDVLDEHRRAGRKVVFANGVFDLLHVGHVRYLQACLLYTSSNGGDFLLENSSSVLFKIRSFFWRRVKKTQSV